MHRMALGRIGCARSERSSVGVGDEGVRAALDSVEDGLEPGRVVGRRAVKVDVRDVGLGVTAREARRLVPLPVELQVVDVSVSLLEKRSSGEYHAPSGRQESSSCTEGASQRAARGEEDDSEEEATHKALLHAVHLRSLTGDSNSVEALWQ